jgi:hypothetical protein
VETPRAAFQALEAPVSAAYALDGGQVAFLVTVAVVGLGLFALNVYLKRKGN